MTFKCFKCNQEIVFSPMQVGKNGKKIPLDPATELPHDCPMRDKKFTAGGQSGDLVIGPPIELEDKDDHGNEDTGPRPMQEKESPKFLDHTLPPKLKLTILTDPTAAGLTKLYNDFPHPIKFSQYQLAPPLYTMAVYYEESK